MTSITYAICLFTLFIVKLHAADETTLNQEDAEDFLAKYGYLNALPGGKRAGGAHQRSLALRKAITSFQDFAGLPVTGQLDETTKRQMLAPRCGMTDAKKNTRTAVSKWQNKPTITWALTNGTAQIDDGRVRTGIQQALDLWSAVIPLNFTEVNPQSGADMQFLFGTKNHGDPYPFDGRGTVLAHAFYPSDGRLHFDDDELWALNDVSKIQQGYVDLLSVAVHELGHSLGLPHSKEQDAIMFPYYAGPKIVNGKQEEFRLSRFDIQDIQEVYGPRDNSPNPATTPAPSGGSSTGGRCPQFQAAVTGPNGATYFFVDGTVGWMKRNVQNGPANSATQFPIEQTFPGVLGVGAAVMDTRDQRTYLFVGRQVFAYSFTSSTGQFQLVSGFPKTLQNDVPFTPYGAFQLNEGHLILFQGDQFVIYDPDANSGSFLNSVSSYFGKLPGVSSFAVGDKTYFLNGNTYSIYDMKSQNVVSTQPLNTLITC